MHVKKSVVSFLFLFLFLIIHMNSVLALGKGFLDLSENDWYYDAVENLFEKKIMFGYQDGTFKPNQYATRAELAMVVDRVLKRIEEDSRNVEKCIEDWESKDGLDYAPGKLIISFKEDVSKEKIYSIVDIHDLVIEHEFQYGNMIVVSFNEGREFEIMCRISQEIEVDDVTLNFAEYTQSE